MSKVYAPEHYCIGGIETKDYIRAKLTPEAWAGYCNGNVLKYISRHTEKDGLQDLQKARVYLDWLIEAKAPQPQMLREVLEERQNDE